MTYHFRSNFHQIQWGYKGSEIRDETQYDFLLILYSRLSDLLCFKNRKKIAKTKSKNRPNRGGSDRSGEKLKDINRTFQNNKLETGRRTPVQYTLNIGIYSIFFFGNYTTASKESGRTLTKELFQETCKKNRCTVDIGPIYTYRCCYKKNL